MQGVVGQQGTHHLVAHGSKRSYCGVPCSFTSHQHHQLAPSTNKKREESASTADRSRGGTRSSSIPSSSTESLVTNSSSSSGSSSSSSTEPCSISCSKELVLSWPGSGLYFFWQLGAVKYLSEHFDLGQVRMVGASGGALAAVLAACGVPADKVVSSAYELSLEHGIWERPLALLGIWGGLVERWLHELLPEDAHERCRGRVTVVVTTLPDMSQVGISDFADRTDLINACMASAHVPFLLDFKGTRSCRGKPCVDGQLPDLFRGNCDLLTLQGAAVVFDYFDDVMLKRQGRMDMLQLRTYEEICERMELGYEYAKKLHAEGALPSTGRGSGSLQVVV